MRVKSLVTVVVWIVALLFGVNLVRAYVARSSSAPPAPPLTRTLTLPTGTITVTPYTVMFDLGQQKGGRTAASKATAIKRNAMRGDGSIAMQLEVLGGQIPVSSRRLLLASGETVTTNDVLERKHTRSGGTSVQAGLRDPRTRCVKTFAGTPLNEAERVEGEEMIAGYRTVRVRVKDGITMWYALDVGCAELRSRVTHPSGDVIDATATKVTLGEPAGSLFDVEGFTEVPREQLTGRQRQ